MFSFVYLAPNVRFIYCADKVHALSSWSRLQQADKNAKCSCRLSWMFLFQGHRSTQGLWSRHTCFASLNCDLQKCAFLLVGLMRLHALQLSSYGNANCNLPVTACCKHSLQTPTWSGVVVEHLGGSRISATQISHCEIRSDPCCVSKFSSFIWLFINTRKAALCFTVTYQCLQKGWINQ